ARVRTLPAPPGGPPCTPHVRPRGPLRLILLEDRCLPAVAGPGVAVVNYLSDPQQVAVVGPASPAHSALIDWGDGSSSAAVVEAAGPDRVSVQVQRAVGGPPAFH